jgi:putative PIN family toxin of toxin-antitoxin system
VQQAPKFKNYFSDNNISGLLSLFNEYGLLIEVTTTLDQCRDIKDNFLLNLAIDSNADYLITSDNDLLTLNKIGKTKILNTAISKIFLRA